MQGRFNLIWFVLLITATLLGVLYVWFTIFPGPIKEEVLEYFSRDQVQMAWKYTRFLRVLSIVGFIIKGAFLCWVVFGGAFNKLFQGSFGYVVKETWQQVVVFSLLLWLTLMVLELPFRYLGEVYWQNQWGFSTQSLGGWGLDYVKGLTIDLVLLLPIIICFYFIYQFRPKTWWVIGAFGTGVLIIIQIYLWPVLISPIFNKFEPARDVEIITMVETLSEKAGLEIDEVLIMDASSRTTKSNAYFTGLGATKRIVLYDNLINDYSPDEVEAVVAHEMAHWRRGHVLKGLLWGLGGIIFFWGFAYLMVRLTSPVGRMRFSNVLSVLLLVYFLISFLSNPFSNYLSRTMENEADYLAVKYTGKLDAAISLQLHLSKKNFSDISPHPFIKWFGYSHPPASERIKVMREAARQVDTEKN